MYDGANMPVPLAIVALAAIVVIGVIVAIRPRRSR